MPGGVVRVIIRGPRPEIGWTQISNDAIRDFKLSYKAVGLLAHLLSLPPGASTDERTLAQDHTDGVESVRTGLAELRKAGYLVRIQRRDRGRFITDTYIYDTVEAAKEAVASSQVTPHTGFPSADEPSAENQGGKNLEGLTKNKNLLPDTADAEPVRADVESLCVLLADLVERNGSKRPKITQGWRDAARRMIDIDGRDPVKAEALIRWCQADEFWRGNILSMPKFRAQYDRLRLRAIADWERDHQGAGAAQGRRAEVAGPVVRPDGSVDADAVLGREPWSLPTPPSEIADDPNRYVEWAREQRDAYDASRQEQAREVLRQRGVIT